MPLRPFRSRRHLGTAAAAVLFAIVPVVVPVLLLPHGGALRGDARGPARRPAAASPTHPAATTGPAGPVGPNLVVVSVAWSPAWPSDGDHVVFRAVVRNTGNRPTPTLTHGIAFVLDGSTVTWSGASVVPLNPGEQRTYVADESSEGPGWWPARFGTYQLTAWADDANRIPETSEADNTLSVTFTVT